MPLDVMPFRVHTLNETPFVALRRFEHPRGAILQDSEEQAADQFQINIVEQDWFRLGHDGREWTLGAGCVFLSRPGDLYRYSHPPEVEPDTCLSMAFSATSTEGVAERFKRLPLVPPITNRLNFLQLQLGSIIRNRFGNAGV